MMRRLICSALIVTVLFASAPAVATQNTARLTRMADQLDAMDHAEFEEHITEVIRCIRSRAFACADAALAQAAPLVTGPGDQATLVAARTQLANQRLAVAAEQQAAIDREAAAYRAAEAAKQEEYRRADAEYRRQKDQMLAEQEAAGAFSAGAQIMQELARNQQSQARINDIHNQAMANMANIDAQAADRRAREENARRASERDARDRAYADQRRSADAAADSIRAAQQASAAQNARNQAAPQSNAAPRPGTASGPKPTPPARKLYTWPYRFDFKNQFWGKTEAEARTGVAKQRAITEAQFDQAKVRYRIGDPGGYASWRVTLNEPVRCVEKAHDTSRPYWLCSQRVDYLMEADHVPMPNVIYS